MRKTVILASGSPQRKELMYLITARHKVVVPNIIETLDLNRPIEEAVMKLAEEKAKSVQEKHEEYTVIACDTVIWFENEVFGKPKDKQDACDMLQRLSGKTHRVITGVAFANKYWVETFYTEAFVTFKDLSKQEIYDYVDLDKPLDKAGAYAIQSLGENLIDCLDGDIFTVIGFPVNKIYEVYQRRMQRHR